MCFVPSPKSHHMHVLGCMSGPFRKIAREPLLSGACTVAVGCFGEGRVASAHLVLRGFRYHNKEHVQQHGRGSVQQPWSQICDIFTPKVCFGPCDDVSKLFLGSIMVWLPNLVVRPAVFPPPCPGWCGNACSTASATLADLVSFFLRLGVTRVRHRGAFLAIWRCGWGRTTNQVVLL
jgi:hypothetical protein